MWLEGKLLELAFGKVMLSVGAAVLLSLLILLALWTSVPHASLLEWAALLWGSQAWHAYQQRQFRKATPERRLDFKRWKRISALAAVASGAAWGSTILWFPVSPDDPIALLIIFIIAGCTAFGSVSMAAIPLAASLFLGAALVPLAAWLFSFGEHISTVMGAITLLYWASMALMSRQIYAMTCRMFTSAEQNRVLVSSFAHVKQLEQENARRDNERRYGGLFENFEESIFFVDVLADGGFRVASINPAGERMFGLNRDAAKGKSKFDLFPADVAERLVAHDRTCVETGQTLHYEEVLDGPDGARHFSVTNIPMLDDSGKVIQIAAIARDITAQKQADMLLQTREAEFRTLAENAVDPIYRYDRNCRRIYINPAVEKLTGVPAARLLGKSPIEAIPNPSVNAVNAQQAIQRVLDTGEPGELEVDLIGADGQRAVVHNALVPEFDADGTVQSVLCIGRDITAHKRIEEVLQRSETEYRMLATNLPVAVIRYDTEQRRRYINPAAERMLHGTAAGLLGQLPGEGGVPALPEMIAHYRGKMNEALQTGTARELEFVLDALPLAQQEHYEVRFAPEFDADGKVSGVLAIWYDITGRKRMENEMRQQAEFQQSLLGAINEVGMQLMVVENGEITYVSNRKLACEFGYTDGELESGIPLLDIIHPDDRARVMDYHVRRLVGDASVPSSYEIGLVTKHGERREYETSAAVVGGGDSLRVITIGKDISERKRMEQELATHREKLEELVRQRTGELLAREALLRALVDNLPFEFFAMDNAQTYTMQNRVSIENYGSVVGKRIEELGLPQDVLDTWREQNRAVLAGGTQHSEYEKEVAGEKRVFESLVAPVRTGDAIIGLVGVAMDITERKADEAQIRTLNAELELRVQDRTRQLEALNRSLGESEQRFRALTENSPDIIIRYDRTCRRLYVNRTAGSLARNPIDKLVGETSADGMLLAPEYAEKLMAGIRAVVADGNIINLELSMTPPDGGMKEYDTLLVPEFGDGKEVETVLLVARDITERKRHEETQQRLARLAESAPGFMFTSHLRPDGTIAMPYASPAIQQVFGLHPGDVLESLAPLQGRIHPDDRAKVAEIIQESACKLALCNAEFRVVHPEKGELWVEARSMPQAQPDGGIQWHGFMVDATERRQAENRQRELERQLQMIADNLPGAFNCYRMHADFSGQMLYANKGMYDVFGLTLEDLRDSLMPMAERMHPDDLKVAAEKITEASRSLSTFTGEFRVNHPDKGEIWVRQITTPVYESESSQLYYGMMFDITAQKVAEQYERFRSSVMERLAESSPLAQILEEIVRGVEQLNPAMICSILLLDEKGTHLGSGIAPSLPDFYNAAIDGIEIGAGVGSCGTCAATGERVIVEDIQTHPYWAPFKGLAAQAGLGACWSQPILAASGKVLGTFAIYHREPHAPVEHDLSLIENAAHMASIAIERKYMEEELKLKEYVLEHARLGVYLIDDQARFTYVNNEACRELGYSRDELLAMSAMDIDAERASEKVMEVRRKSVMEGAFTFETEHVRRDGSHVPVEIWASTLEYKGKGLGVALALNVSERKRMEEEIRMKGWALDNSSDAMYLIGELGHFVYVNDQASRALGYSREELLTMGVPDIDPDYSAPSLADRSEKIQKEGGSFIFETHHRRRDGTLIPVEIQMSELNYNGQVLGLALARDISERKRAVNALRQSEMKFRTLYDSTGDAVMLLDMRGFFDCNASALKMFGCASLEEFCTKHPADLSPPEQPGGAGSMELANRHIAQAMQDGSHRFEWVHRRADSNESFPAEVLLSAMELDGKPVLQATVRDITERKQAELALRASEVHAQERSALLNAIMESSPEVIVFALDREYRYLAFNRMHQQVMQAIWGKRIALGMSMLEVIGRADDRATAQRDFDRALTGESFITESAYGDEALLREYWQTLWSPIRAADGEVTGLTCYVLNISERRRMEEALAASERDFRSLAGNMPDNIARWDTEGRYLYINPTHERLLGSKLEELVGQPISDSYGHVKAGVAHVVATGQAIHAMRQPAMIEGAEQLHDVSLVPEFDETGKVVSVLGIGRDMTERYRLLEAIAAREQEFRSLAESAPDNIVRYDREGRVRYLNERLLRQLGYSSLDEVIGKRPSEFRTDGRFAALEEAAARVVASGERAELEVKEPDGKGGWMYHLISVVAERNEQGEIVGTIAFGRDITNMRSTERLMQMIGDHMPGALTHYRLRADLSGELLYASRGLQDLYGFTREDMVDGIAPMIGRIHPDDLPKAIAEQEHAAKTLTTAVSEFRVNHPEKGEIWVQQITTPLPEADGSMLWYSLMFDISERKRMEAQLAQERATLRAFFGAMPNLAWMKDTEGRYLACNPAHEGFLGVPEAEVIGKSDFDFVDAELAAFFRQKDKEAEAAGKPCVNEEWVTFASDGRRALLETVKSPVFDAEGRIVGVIGVAHDITERKQMEEMLVARERDFRSLAENMPDNIARWDTEGRYLFVNPVHERTLEKSASELIGKPLPDTHEHVKAAIAQVMASGQAIHAVRQPVPVNGIEELHDVSLVPEFDAAGNIVSVLGIGRDMTERYRMQEALAAREAEFRTLVEQAPEPIFRYAPDGRRIYVNAAVERISGVPSDKLLEAQPSDGKLSHGGNGDKIVELIRQVCATGEHAEIEVEHHGADGMVRWYNQRLAPEFGLGGKVRSVLSICHDITARKLAEIQLKETLAFSEGVINAIPDLLFEVDRDGRYLNIWAQKQGLLAAQRDLLLGRTINEMLAPDAATTSMSAIREADEKGFCLGKTICLQLPQGTSWFELSVSKKSGAGSGGAHFLVLSRDITERVKMEEALRASEEKLRNLFALSPLGLALTDMNGKYVEFNEAFRRICGYPEAELHTLDYWTLTPRKYEAQEAEQLASLARIGRYGPYEKEYRQQDGSLVPIQLNGVKVTGADGKEYIWSIVEDISERKRMEANLRESRDFLRHIMDGISDPIFVKDRRHRWIEFNDAFCNLVGQSRETMLGKSDYDFLPKEQADVFWGMDELVFSSGETNINEEAITGADGELRHIQTKKMMAHFEGEGGDLLIGVIRDITERKRIEERLKSSYDALEEAQRIGHIGSWDVDMVNDRLTWSDETFRIWEIDKEKFAATFEAFLNTVHPDDRERVARAYNDAIVNRSLYEIEHRLLFPDGRIKYILERGEPYFDANGKPVRFVGTSLEITERKEAEMALLENYHRITELNDELERSSGALQEKAAELEMQTVELEMSKEQLQQTEEWYRSIMHSAPDGMLIVDSRGIIMQTNAQLDALFGYEGGELPGSRVEVLVPQAMQQKHIGLRKEFHVDAGVEMRMAGSARNLMGRRKDGSEFPVDVSLSRLPDMEGRVGAVCAAVRDMSERSKMEAARENALSEALRLAQMRSTFLAQMSHELRTPLNGILGYAQNLMHGGSLGEKEAAGLSIIKHSGEHLLSLINGLLDHAAIEADKFELIPGDIRLEEFLATMIGIIRVRAEQKNVAFACELEADLPGMVRGDAQRLRQVLLNLLSNAVKFTDSGSVVLKVKRAGTARMHFEVRDSGVGIAPDELERIFQPFEQVGEVSRRAGGSGLGLAISRKLVRLMGGDILVESQSGAGSVFWFEIDMEQVESDVATVNVDALVEQAANSAAVPVAELIVPPRADLETLAGYVQRGSMRDVQRFADSLLEQDERYAAFVEQLRKLAKNFQTKALRGLIDHYLQEKEGGQ